MVMPSTVSHVRKSLEKTLKLILGDQKVVAELLKEYEPDVAKDFINTYVTLKDDEGNKIKDAKKFEIRTTVPQEVTEMDNTFLIDMGEGSESATSGGIGNVVNTYDYDGKDSAKYEKLEAVYDAETETITLETSNGIGELIDIEEMDLIRDQIKVKGNNIIISIPYYEAKDLNLIGNPLQVTVKYMPSTGNDFVGIIRGYDVTENVRVVMMSKNLDTLRIMDTLLKASLIIMRSFDKEDETYKLAKASYSDTAPVVDEVPSMPYKIFGREARIQYTVTYGLDEATTKFLSSIDIHL